VADTVKRRTFIKGAVAAAVATSLPGGDGVALQSATHPAPALLPMFGDADTGIFSPSSDHLSLVTGERYAKALAQSMKQTREQVTANVLNKVFKMETTFDLSPASLEEIEVDIKRGGSTDEPEGDVRSRNERGSGGIARSDEALRALPDSGNDSHERRRRERGVRIG
jgi:hypothetical protein